MDLNFPVFDTNALVTTFSSNAFLTGLNKLMLLTANPLYLIAFIIFVIIFAFVLKKILSNIVVAFIIAVVLAIMFVLPWILTFL